MNSSAPQTKEPTLSPDRAMSSELAPVSILYVSHVHPPRNRPMESIGGMQTVSMKLLEQFRRHPSVRVIEHIQHTPWKAIKRRTALFLARGIRRLPGVISRQRPDVVLFTSMVTAAMAPRLRARGVRIPMMAINHGHDVTMPFAPYQWYLRRVFRSLDAVVSVSSATRQASVERGADPDRSTVIPNGIERLFTDGLPEQAMAQELLWLQLGPMQALQRKGRPARPILLTVGRLIPRKGHAWFIEHVLPKIQEPVEYLVIGEGPEMERLKPLADQVSSRTPHRVQLLGRQEDETMRIAYAAADLFIMPNIPVPGDMEGFGVVLLEANLARTPAVASDLEGIRDVVRNGVNGFRVPPLDADAFAARVGSMLAMRPTGELGALGMQAARHVSETFTWDAIVELYLSRIRLIQGR